jgi:hypothetical protein
MIVRLLRQPWTWAALGVLVVLAALGAYWLQPWRLLTSTTVNDALSAPTTAAAPSAAAESRVVLHGTLVTHEHNTSGDVRIVRQPDGSHQLELVNLATSEGPDVQIRLSDQDLKGPGVFTEGKWFDIGRLKGNKGNQVYVIPSEVDVSTVRSVSIWCKRFSVSFGAAALS